MKLIIDIPDHLYNVIKNKECTNKNVLTKAVENGTPLDDVKAEIENRLEEEVTKTYDTDALKHHSWGLSDGLKDAMDILDNIGKESEVQK